MPSKHIKHHTSNPYHDTLTKHGFEHSSTKDNVPDNVVIDYYTHPDYSGSLVSTVYHENGSGTNSWHHYTPPSTHLNDNYPYSAGSQVSDLDKHLIKHYGKPKQ